VIADDAKEFDGPQNLETRKKTEERAMAIMWTGGGWKIWFVNTDQARGKKKKKKKKKKNFNGRRSTMT
jgi:hypothetical protein